MKPETTERLKKLHAIITIIMWISVAVTAGLISRYISKHGLRAAVERVWNGEGIEP
jgi:ABC-type thiamin/hydroxymethylpyrimidine transport system permease subunit